jgi:hypothetical protein
MDEKAFQLAPDNASVIAVQGSTLVFVGKLKKAENTSGSESNFSLVLEPIAL